MNQITLKKSFHVGFGGTTQYGSLWGSFGDMVLTGPFGQNYAKCVMPISGTLKNLTLTSHDTLHDITFTIFKSTGDAAGSATALLVTIPSGTSPAATNSSDTVSFSEEDNIYFQVVTSGGASSPGYDIGFSIELEVAEQIYSISPFAGSLAADAGIYGGMLGNGQFNVISLPLDPTRQESSTFSIVSVPGTITSLAAQYFSVAAISTGSYDIYLTKNNILQDGTGGTVNTKLTITPASDIYGKVTFSLDVTLGDTVDVIVVRKGTNFASSGSQVSCSVTFTPVDEESFLLTGGDGFDMALSDGWLWNGISQTHTVEIRNLAPVGISGLRITGLYVRLFVAPGVGVSWQFTIQKNGVDTVISFSISNTVKVGQIYTQEIDFDFGDTIVLAYNPIGTPITGEVHWGLMMSFPEGPPPPDVEGGIYKVVPGKREDTLWNENFDGTTDVKIPNPIVKLGGIG